MPAFLVTRKFLSLLLLCALVLVGCQGDGEQEADDPAAPGDAGGEAGDVGGEEGEVAGCDDVDLSGSPDEPVLIRIGHGDATEAPWFLQVLEPEAVGAEHYGTWYTMEATQFAPPDRLSAYQAGQIDAGSAASPQLMSAVEQGLDIAAMASLAVVLDDEGETYAYSYLALEESGIEGPEDLQGATIGIIAPNTSTEYWAISAVRSAGLDPARDVEFVSVPPPTAEEALRTGQVDVQFFNDVFYPQAVERGGVVEVFDAITGPGFDQEFLSVWFDRSFVRDNPEAYCAWAEDYQAAMAFLLDNREEAGTILIDAGYDQAPSLEAYLARPQPGRKRDGRIDLDNLQRLIDNKVETGFMDLTITAEDLVMPGYSLTE